MNRDAFVCLVLYELVIILPYFHTLVNETFIQNCQFYMFLLSKFSQNWFSIVYVLHYFQIQTDCKVIPAQKEYKKGDYKNYES